MDASARRPSDLERASRISQARRELGLSQLELATRMGVPIGVVKNAEAGREISAKHLRAIAAATGKPVSWFSEQAETPTEGWALLGKLHGDVADLRTELASRLDRLEADLEAVRMRIDALEAERRTSQLAR